MKAITIGSSKDFWQFWSPPKTLLGFRLRILGGIYYSIPFQYSNAKGKSLGFTWGQTLSGSDPKLHKYFIIIRYYENMARPPRIQYSDELFYHLMNRGNNKNNIFLTSEAKYNFELRALKYFEEYKIAVDTFCIMNSHFHLLFQPSKNTNVSKMIQGLCSSYGLYYNKRFDHIGHVFQGRYKVKEITTFQGFLNVRKYIQQNPVKAEYCDKSENYRWLWSEGLTPWGSDPTSPPA